MKSEERHIDREEIKRFIWKSVCYNGRITVWGKGDTKAVIDSGRYVVKIMGKYEVQPNKGQTELIEIFVGLIDRYKTFEYDGNLYHSPERNIWIVEEI